MFSQNLNALIREFPEERDAVSRLTERFIRDAEKLGDKAQYPANRIYDVAQPMSGWALLAILERLCELGILSKFVRVESDRSGAIDDFATVLDVPHVLFDPKIGHDVEIRPDQLKLYFRLQPKDPQIQRTGS
ncbi:hypothetical protein [Achromobacter insuavis]|uniref:hypothetical protein n=1 Tax=Achromobacter insuavis TaxID=1287735 RepID=UPI001F12F088|nr:hypothetical protein [Achromobacter insuavis]